MTHDHPHPLRRLVAVAWSDRGDLLVLAVYALMSALLALAVPLSAQALVNSIAAGLSVQPLVVLTAAVLAGGLLYGLVILLRLCLVEVMQQRIFARTALALSDRLPHVDYRALAHEDGSELLNRFFDVMTIQKTWAKLATDGPGAFIEVAVGLALLAFYGPILLAFDLILVGAGVTLILLCSFGGLSTSIRESVQKYRVAGWLEEIAVCQNAFKLTASPDFCLDRTDQHVQAYIRARRSHFAVLLRQHVVWYLLQAVASAGILGLGGWMVINQQLTLGQLVASELVVLAVLKSAEKLVRLLDSWFDLLTALDKVGHLLDLPLDRREGRPLPSPEGPAKVSCRSVTFAWRPPPARPVFQGLDLHIAPGERVCLVGTNGSGKTTLARLLAGVLTPDEGRVAIDGVDVRETSLAQLSRHVALVASQNEIIEDTLATNVVLGRDVPPERLHEALRGACVDDHLPWLPLGVETPLARQSHNLSRGQWMRVQIARAILTRPRLLILDDAMAGIDDPTREALFERLYQGPWTLLCISHRPQTVRRADRVLVLHEGAIVESGPPAALAATPGSHLSRLFPELCPGSEASTHA